MEVFRRSVGAGIMVGLASFMFLNVGGLSGALLFCSALYFICLFSLDLFTGKIGWLGRDGNPLSYFLVVLLGNLAGSLILSLIGLASNPNMQEVAQGLIQVKLETPWLVQAAKACACGILMYLAVKAFKTGDGIVRYFGIFFAIPIFIMSGFEHSIADAGYMFVSGTYAFVPRLLWIVLFNGVGSVLAAFFLEKPWEFSVKKVS